MRIIAIGGGEFKTRTTLPIDIKIKEMTGLERPKVVFIPTASQESGGYITTFRHVYGQELGCKTVPLMLGKGEPKTPQQVMDKVLAGDAIYVGSGNSRYMLDTWKAFGVDKALREAAARGKVLSGLSAGAICWFEYSWSDYPLLEGTGRYALLPALGLLPGLVCPHCDEPGRMDGLEEAVARTGKGCLCLPNHGAIVIDGERYCTMKTRPEARILRMEPDGRLWEIPEAGSLSEIHLTENNR